MEKDLENQIIGIIEKDVERFSSCSIKQAAHSAFYNDISLSEQKELAKIIVKKNHFITEIQDKEIIVKKNLLYSESKNDTAERYQLLKYIMMAIAGLLSYLVFKVFLPNL